MFVLVNHAGLLEHRGDLVKDPALIKRAVLVWFVDLIGFRGESV